MSLRLFVLLTVCLPLAARADVSVRFDARQTVACQDVTTEEFAVSHPGERLWEAKLEISSLIQGSERSLSNYFYQVDSLQRELTFEDYAPKTTVESPYAGSVDVIDKDEKTRNIGVAVTLDTAVKLTPTVGAGRKSSSQISYSLLPPKEQVAASGTQRRGRGVYFKLRPSTQHTLEGGKQFALVFRAPAAWRAGTMLLRCEASGVKKGLFRDETASTGRALFMLALYRAGDIEAMRSAQQYAAAEGSLRRAASRAQAAIKRHQESSGSFFLPGSSPETPRIPIGWLERLLVTPGESNWPQYADHLPSAVRQTGRAFLTAKLELRQLGARVTQ